MYPLIKKLKEFKYLHIDDVNKDLDRAGNLINNLTRSRKFWVNKYCELEGYQRLEVQLAQRDKVIAKLKHLTGFTLGQIECDERCGVICTKSCIAKRRYINTLKKEVEELESEK